jgi:hypothetical protein
MTVNDVRPERSNNRGDAEHLGPIKPGATAGEMDVDITVSKSLSQRSFAVEAGYGCFQSVPMGCGQIGDERFDAGSIQRMQHVQNANRRLMTNRIERYHRAGRLVEM